jgi:hypothetical protein
VLAYRGNHRTDDPRVEPLIQGRMFSDDSVVDLESCLNVDGNVYVEAALLKQLAYLASDLFARLDADRN